MPAPHALECFLVMIDEWRFISTGLWTGFFLLHIFASWGGLTGMGTLFVAACRF
jgi:hypothetical protein